MQDRAETLEGQLAEKEQLVAALTERLEQAAEQLDRLHRTGADRTLRSGIAGIPPELIQQQQQLVEDLQRAVQQWEDMQPGAFFGRLEAQLAHIEELILHSGARAPHGALGSSESKEGNRSGSGTLDSGDSHGGSAPPSMSILEFLKGRQENGAAPEERMTESAAEGAPGIPASLPIEVTLPPLQDPPQAINTAQATLEELSAACEARDSYIIYLLQRLRQIESLGHVPNSWADVEGVPQELRLRLEVLEKRLEETLRLAEVELSLQRAKVAREEARVRLMDEQMQKELKRLRGASGDHAGDEPARHGEDGSGSRWKRILSRRHGESQ